MFRLLSKESTIFSIPLYIGFLLVMLIFFNLFEISDFAIISTIVTFVGVALGYFCFNAIKLNYLYHLPLFLYTFFVFALYPGNLDIGIAVTLLSNSFIILILTDVNEDTNKKSYILIGTLLVINYIFLPTTWPMILFVILHVISTSQRIGLQLFRVIFGAALTIFSYFSVVYFLGYHSWNEAYLPFYYFNWTVDFQSLYPLIPVVLLLLYAVLDHFNNYNKKSPVSKYKYTFILIFTVAQLLTIVFYMGSHYEYLLLLALPISIILSRMLNFLPKYWMREVGLWSIIICLLIFKISYYFKYF
ncbi:DUF6427 family protein [Frigoriflavimonas asaccharolytica]|uniref:Uncharacterized protein n=1 Tax=Frigoriflavimonas asaccharolytica TaxID=2735899 RepID=A0A8J8K6X2_9FLAO|nr:DUF6427 family protein [Frigoriflavimonas asaccharolytica]NRS91413.1 hypothetical protein [Frigoriflavimonas asaccharolytica]